MKMIDKTFIIDESGRRVATIAIRDAEEGWYYGTLLQDHFRDEQKKALDWYDDVLTGQMLSYLDEALDAVDALGLQVQLSETGLAKLYSLHVSKDGDVSFRTTPVPPPRDRSRVRQEV